MTALWTSAAIANATSGQASADFSVSGVAFDSREIGPGDLFVALKGEHSDGHLHVEQAFSSGAAGAIVSQPVAGPHILVADTARALDALGKASRSRTDAKIIGVTGSVGKTGTKEALYAALDRCSFGKAHRSVKSYNNHVGVPLSLSRMPQDTKFGIFEMGMNHAHELSALTRLVRPHAAIITAIAPAHIGNFPNGEVGIVDAKAEIFEGLMPGGTAIIPHDSPHCQRLRSKAERYADHVITFGFDQGADVRAVDIVPAPRGGSLVTANLGDQSLCFTIAEAGRHWVSNSLAILAAVRAVGGDLATAGLALAEMSGIDGRGRRHLISLKSGGKATVIDESYNANPASMKATLQHFTSEPCTGQKIVILGAMGELGEQSAHYHASLADDILLSGADTVILVGEDMAHTAAKLEQGLDQGVKMSHAASASEALTEVAKLISDGDILLIKGSNYLGLSSAVSALVSGEY
ncbi:UDP-N-acetylmuramoyl-tripeptide--D-alanyl-D-alanine ligase [Sphingorhabdus sp. M41]|uniref:UDP-N-acetylmuramoyl-tripeptide--D-alanyl-D- alanine ligase n=1 Tax=Sphingorhabdus sp. M41 TaxID=1806885 RepID=UPI00078ED78A|nr:UDP-N-acetylmuramoyl-tripeptide--D-alanyl-D-alanine ligase [Sphingorhabdus sp. M41]AMO72257.1 UDP-N-acetylmuramoylalanyl-D-glutamyl-2, 6-diaminopimelate--D-alanyl-D-alanine ligase [Sphingorhabdus sp. M41]